jgi:hypothetical protein
MAVKAAISEAQRRNDSHLGAEHLLLGVAAVSSASSRRVVDLSVVELRVGLDSLDESALASVGIDIAAVGSLVPDLGLRAAGTGRSSVAASTYCRTRPGSLSMLAIGGSVPNTSFSPSSGGSLRRVGSAAEPCWDLP